MTRSRISEYAELYKEAGLTTFPCSKNKKPIDPGWQTDDYDAVDLGKIYGVALSDTFFVLDVDPRRYVDGEMNFNDLMDKFGIAVPVNTFVVKTGNGAHVYFKCPPGRKYKMYVPGTGKAIECKSLGRYVIGAGSIHPKTGEPYTVLRGSLDNLMEAPEELLKYCEQVSRKIGEETIDDSEENQSRFIKYCLSAPPAIEGEGGNNATYLVACKASDFGLSEKVCFDTMWEYYNSRCYPEWSESEMLAIIEHAYEYCQNTRGHNSTVVDADELDTVSDEKPDLRDIGKSKPRKRSAGNDNDVVGFMDSAVPRLQYGEHGWDWYTNKEGVQLGLKPTTKNLVNFLISDHAEKEGIENPFKNIVGFNELSHRIEFTRRAPWRHDFITTFAKNDYVQMRYYFATRRDLDFKLESVEEAVIIAAMDNHFNPLTEMLDGLKWDGKPRLDTWMIDYLNAENNDYVKEVGRITLISAVARGYDPGCKVDTMTVLEGPQGQGKGTVVEILGGEFSSSMQLHLNSYDDHKKTIMRMLGKWIIEIPEMTFTRKQEIEAVKAFLTTRVDNVVLPWSKVQEDIKRRSIFIGTFNPTEDGAYLNDTTGNRRYLPVKTGKYNIDALREVRDQLIAEAVVRYKAGAKWHMTDEELIRAAEEEQAARTVKEVWAERLEEYLEEYDGELKFTKLQVCRVVTGNVKQIDRQVERRVGKAMRELGFTYHPFYEDGKTVRYWVKEKKKRKKD